MATHIAALSRMLIICSFLTTFVIYRLHFIPIEQLKIDRIQDEISSNGTILILSMSRRCFGCNDTPWWKEGEISNCDANRCEYYHNKPELYQQSHAVLISGHTIDLERVPASRPDGQKWIFYQYESPVHTRQEVVRELAMAFNLTSTYEPSSDVSSTYGKNFKLDEPCQVSSSWNNTLARVYVERNVRNKTKFVAWFVSRCHSQSQRELYVQELSKFVPVDIYGKCGKLKCSKKCYQMLEGNYKFYLAFENSFCKDYVTEKLFRMLNIDVVPIVLGGANYSKFLPSETFVDVRDFTSPEKLAKFLKFLDKRKDLYTDYLLRKRAMVCAEEEPYVCRLCKHLHATKRKVTRINLLNAWNKTKHCINPENFYRSHFQ